MPPADVTEWPAPSGGHSRRPSFVRTGQILVDVGDVDEARTHFGAVQTTPSNLGITRVTLPPGRDNLPVELPAFRARLRAKPGWTGRLPTPNCWLQPWVSPGGGSGPTPVQTAPAVRPNSGAAAPTVLFDGALLKNHQQLPPLDRASAAPADQVADGGLTTAWRRHGSFVASALLSAKNLPGAVLRDVFGDAGGIDDWELAMAVDKHLQANPDVRVVNLSCGVFAPPDSPPLGLRALVETYPAVLWVASAGNLDLTGGTDPPWPAYPAFFPSVVGVGATDYAGHRAAFTDLLSVDVWAPGVDVVGVFGGGTLDPTGQVFDKYARWSGTSFAAPVVAAELTAFVLQPGQGSGETLAKNAIHWLKLRYPGADIVVL